MLDGTEFIKFMVPGSVAGGTALLGLSWLGLADPASLALAGLVGTLVMLCLNWTKARGDYDFSRSVDLLRFLGHMVVNWFMFVIGSVPAAWVLGLALRGIWPGLP